MLSFWVIALRKGEFWLGSPCIWLLTIYWKVIGLSLILFPFATMTCWRRLPIYAWMGFNILGQVQCLHILKKNPLKKCLTTCLKEHFVAQVKHIFWTLSIRSKLMQTSFTKILLKILPPENAIKNLYTELKGIKLLFSSKSGIFGVFIDVWYKHDLKEGCCMQLAFFCVSRPVWNKFSFDKSKM